MGTWWQVVSLIHNWQITEVLCEDILQPMYLTPPEHQFRKSFLGDNWLCETYILVQESLEFLVERTGEGERWGRLGHPDVVRWRKQTTESGGLEILPALLLTRPRSLWLFVLSFLIYKMNELRRWEKLWLHNAEFYYWPPTCVTLDQPSGLSGL